MVVGNGTDNEENEPSFGINDWQVPAQQNVENISLFDGNDMEPNAPNESTLANELNDGEPIFLTSNVEKYWSFNEEIFRYIHSPSSFQKMHS